MSQPLASLEAAKCLWFWSSSGCDFGISPDSPSLFLPVNSECHFLSLIFPLLVFLDQEQNLRPPDFHH